MEPSLKRQRTVAATVSSITIMDLPTDCLRVICEFCTSSDLHYTMPLICKHIREFLKEKWTNDHEDDSFFTTITCTTENLLWKDRCCQLLPKIMAMIKDDRLFNYRRYYVLKFNPLKPLFVYVPDLTNLRDKHKSTLSNSLDDFVNIANGSSPHELFSSITSFVKQLDDIKRDCIDIVQTSSANQQKMHYPSIRRYEFFGIEQFLKKASIKDYKEKAVNLYDGAEHCESGVDAFIVIFSPLNGNSVKFELHCSVEGDNFHENAMDVQNKSITFTFTLYDKDNELESVSLLYQRKLDRNYNRIITDNQHKRLIQKTWQIIQCLDFHKLVINSNEANANLIEDFYNVISRSIIHFFDLSIYFKPVTKLRATKVLQLLNTNPELLDINYSDTMDESESSDEEQEDNSNSENDN
jgi:hypothetical protein